MADRDYTPGMTADFKFTTTSAGAPTALSGGTVSVYKGNDLTQSTAGVTLTADFDGVAGLNHVRIDTSQDSSFYAAGFDYDLVITAGTVGGASVVGYVVGSFSLTNRSVTRPLVRGVVASGGTVNVVPTSSLTPAAVDADQFKGRILIFDKDTATAGLRGEGAPVLASSTLGVLTVETLSRAPASGDTFGIY